jgi:hypothetical protein
MALVCIGGNANELGNKILGNPLSIITIAIMRDVIFGLNVSCWDIG